MWKSIAIIPLLFLGLSAAEARPPGDRGPSPEMEARMQKMRTFMLEKRVGLSGDSLKQVEAALRSFDDQRKALHQAKRQAMQALRKLVRSDSTDDKAYEAALNTLHQARQGLHQLRNQELKKLRPLLTAKQEARLMMALKRLKNKMRRGGQRGPRFDGEHRGGRGGRGGGGGQGGMGGPPQHEYGGQGGDGFRRPAPQRQPDFMDDDWD